MTKEDDKFEEELHSGSSSSTPKIGRSFTKEVERQLKKKETKPGRDSREEMIELVLNSVQKQAQAEREELEDDDEEDEYDEDDEDQDDDEEGGGPGLFAGIIGLVIAVLMVGVAMLVATNVMTDVNQASALNVTGIEGGFNIITGIAVIIPIVLVGFAMLLFLRGVRGT